MSPCLLQLHLGPFIPVLPQRTSAFAHVGICELRCPFDVFPDMERLRGQLEEGMLEGIVSMSASSGPECCCVLI